MPLCTQYGQIIAIETHDPRFIFNAGGYISLIERLPLSNDGISQFDRRLIQQHQVNPLCTQPMPQAMAELNSYLWPGGSMIQQDSQVKVTHRTGITFDL